MECLDVKNWAWIGFRWSVWAEAFAHGFNYFSFKYVFSFCQTKKSTY